MRYTDAVSSVVKQHLSPEEIRALVAPSNALGAVSVAVTWSVVCGAMALAWYGPRLIAIPIALVLVGNRQLAMAVLMHEASHRSLFRTRRLNVWIGQWLAAYPTWNDTERYRTHHLKHHRWTGTDRDPDLNLVTPFPTTRRALMRKCLRDLLGLTAVKRVVGLVLIDFGVLEYNVSGATRRLPQAGRGVLEILATGLRNMGGFLVVHALAIAALWTADMMLLYGLWWAAYMTTYSLFVRLRAIAEHACTASTGDVMGNTRTTRANPLARLTVAPHHVNYHLEHHLLMTVPHYRLRRMHVMLRERGALDGAHLAANYREVLRTAASSR